VVLVITIGIMFVVLVWYETHVLSHMLELLSVMGRTIHYIIIIC